MKKMFVLDTLNQTREFVILVEIALNQTTVHVYRDTPDKIVRTLYALIRLIHKLVHQTVNACYLIFASVMILGRALTALFLFALERIRVMNLCVVFMVFAMNLTSVNVKMVMKETIVNTRFAMD